MHKHVLTRFALGRHPSVDISSDEFASIQQAIAFLHAVTDIERTFDLVIRSFIDFEKSLSNSTIEHMVQVLFLDRVALLHEMQDHLMRLATVLTTSRMYLDQTDKSLKSGTLKSLALATQFNRNRNTHHKVSFSFRLIETLRNFVQHKGHGVHKITHRMQWIGEDDEKKLEHSTDVLLDVGILRSADINAKVRAEISTRSGHLDLREHIREYVERLGSIQSDLRTALADRLSQSKGVLLKAIASFEAVTPDGKAIALVAAERHPNGTLHGEIHLLRTDVEYLDALQQMNGALGNLSRRYASTEVQRKPKKRR